MVVAKLVIFQDGLTHDEENEIIKTAHVKQAELISARPVKEPVVEEI